MENENETQSRKKGRLPGCLLALVIIIVLVVVLVVFGYLNRHKILPFVTDKLGVEVSSVLTHVGTQAEKGMPSGFLDNAYKIDSPQGDKTIRVTTTDLSANRTYARFMEHFRDKGWEVKKELQALEAAPKQLEAVSGYMEEDLSFAELSREGRKMGLAVTRYNDETVGVVWHYKNK